MRAGLVAAAAALLSNHAAGAKQRLRALSDLTLDGDEVSAMSVAIEAGDGAAFIEYGHAGWPSGGGGDGTSGGPAKAGKAASAGIATGGSAKSGKAASVGGATGGSAKSAKSGEWAGWTGGSAKSAKSGESAGWTGDSAKSAKSGEWAGWTGGPAKSAKSQELATGSVAAKSAKSGWTGGSEDSSWSPPAPAAGLLAQLTEAAAASGVDLAAILDLVGAAELAQAADQHAAQDKPDPDAVWTCGWDDEVPFWTGGSSAKAAKSSGWMDGSAKSAKSSEWAGWSSAKSAKSAKSQGKSSKAGSSKAGSSVCPDPSSPGPYEVGYRSFTLNSAPVSGRKSTGIETTELPYSMWYPAKNNGEGPARLELPAPFDIFNYELPGAMENPEFAVPMSSSASDHDAWGSPAADDASCFPLVISSHDTIANGDNYHELHRQLASLGFIVAAPMHQGDSSADLIYGLSQLLASSQTDEDVTDDDVRASIAGLIVLFANRQRSDDDPQDSAYDRPRDVSAVIDDALSGEFGPRICADKIAVIGHSFGGFTALAVANGYDPITDEPEFDTYARDERVKAAVAMAPTIFDNFQDDLADLKDSKVPTLVLSGTKDEASPIIADTNPTWEELRCSTKETYRVDLEGAGHSIYTDICFQLEEANPKLAVKLEEYPSLDSNPAVTCPLLLSSLDQPIDPELAALCLLIFQFALQAPGAGCTESDFLFQEDGKPSVLNYVVAFLESTIGTNECSYDEYLTAKYAGAASLPVDDETLFLKESVDDVCNV